MKNLDITINGLLYTQKDIDKVRKYAEKTFYTTLERLLEDACIQWLNKALEQIEEHEKAANS